tara:strand:+ start:11242 stop:11781 length:540 start_codon:yes stop_codon:yes gene_type:complete
MPVIFGGNTGSVVAIRDNVSEGSISLGNVSGGRDGGQEAFGLGAAPFNSIITRIGVSAAGNYQFLHTIGNDVYVYVFGDRMGDITLHGLSFAQPCQRVTSNASRNIPPVPFDGQHGFEKLFDWYSMNRIAATPKPARVRIGAKTTFKGFITGCTGDVADSKTRTIQFQLTISLLPDDLS